MTQTSLVTRIRTGDVRSIPLGTWLFLGLAIADVVLRFLARGLSFDALSVPSLLIVAAPFLFAAAVFYASPADRRFVYGAMAIAFNELLNVLDYLSTPRFLNFAQWENAGTLLGYTSWLFTLGGLLLIGLALGGVRTRLGWLAVGLGVVLFLVSEVQVFNQWSGLIPDSGLADLGFPIEQVAISFVTPVVAIGWSYVLGAALDHRRRFFALGAALTLVLWVMGAVVSFFFASTPETDFTISNTVFTVINLCAWVALIAGALTEVGPRRERATLEGDAAG